nr:MAG TPA: hypothetical protein [Bacteriophage sp.]
MANNGKVKHVGFLYVCCYLLRLPLYGILI